jgi:hypothetical protein
MLSASDSPSSRSASSGTDLRAWLQGSQLPRRLLRTMQSSGEALTATMWSAVVATTEQMPGNLSRHVGSSATTWSLSLRHALLFLGSETQTPFTSSFRVAMGPVYFVLCYLKSSGEG